MLWVYWRKGETKEAAIRCMLPKHTKFSGPGCDVVCKESVMLEKD
jgi:hypothetical protein